ncbi:hypothetical protein BDW02DRAFT_649019 [Decorospora gaudefroyi]|uniref:Amidohydrolase-related domain-containing protein n=1 Tax=Decorospora gaudefroyi TaxID=184978 RepID=A0A6A5K8H2_9PLEO|nr:hypothetical protein BDW02DRAFT_649019 [Decorospora gaudefroyi]
MPASPSRILDSHIHLWPSTATSPSGHGWMTPGHRLAKRHGISDYLAITDPIPAGFVYVETDRYLPTTFPPFRNEDSDAEIRSKIEVWAKEPLEEIRFLRRMVEGRAEEGDGFVDGEAAERMKGCVLWAPFPLLDTLFALYLQMAEEVAGPLLWGKVVGFRYLLQGTKEDEGVVAGTLTKHVWQSALWVLNLCALRRGRDGAGWCFDIGVDTHRDGVKPFQAVRELIRSLRDEEARGHPPPGKPVRLVLNHLVKPPLSSQPTQPDDQWLRGLSALASDTNIYMKLSGAFNEFDEPTPSDIPTLIKALTPFLDYVFACFHNRVMFGSDWPVCNVGGPRGETGNWKLWREVVEAWMEKRKFGEEERERIWWGAAAEAYGIELVSENDWISHVVFPSKDSSTPDSLKRDVHGAGCT